MAPVLRNIVALIALLVILPLLNSYLILAIAGLDEMRQMGQGIFILFTLPAWIASIIVFSLELARRSILQIQLKLWHSTLLGILGMTSSCIAILISPVRGDLGTINYLVSGMSAFILGTLGGAAYILTIYKRT